MLRDVQPMSTTSLNGDEPYPKRRRLSTDITNDDHVSDPNQAEAAEPVNGTSSIPPPAFTNGEQHAAPQYRLKATLMGHTRGLSAVKISPDGKWIVTASKSLSLTFSRFAAFVLTMAGRRGWTAVAVQLD